MPASWMQRATSSGARSILTPSARSTSAAPDLRGQRAVAVLGDRHAGARDDERGAGRDVEGAGGVAAGADHVDRRRRAPSRRSILARMVVTAPVISSTVSPRTRSAISRPPICEGVASPDIMRSKAPAASSRVSVAPVATLAMSALKSSAMVMSQVVCNARARALASPAVRVVRSTRRRGRENSSASDGRARTRCFRDEIARHAPAASCARAPSPDRRRFRR